MTDEGRLAPLIPVAKDPHFSHSRATVPDLANPMQQPPEPSLPCLSSAASRLLGGLALGLAAIALPLAPAKAAGSRPVSVELVLAVDVSLSVDDQEYQLQVGGIADALRRPEVIEVIGRHEQGVAVTLMQWSGTATQDEEPQWRVLSSRASVLAFAEEVEHTHRSPYGYLTGIGNAILAGVQLLAVNGFIGEDRKIDISGDGRSNSGPEPSGARDWALSQSISINGLAIENTEPGLGDYYQHHVIGGPGAFVIRVANYQDFTEAMARKLVRELELKTADKELDWHFAKYPGMRPYQDLVEATQPPRFVTCNLAGPF